MTKKAFIGTTHAEQVEEAEKDGPAPRPPPQPLTLDGRHKAAGRLRRALSGVSEDKAQAIVDLLFAAVASKGAPPFDAFADAVGVLERLHPSDRAPVIAYIKALFIMAPLVGGVDEAHNEAGRVHLEAKR